MAHESYEFVVDIDGGVEPAKEKEVQVALAEPEDNEVEVEVVDDTPVQDRDKLGKKAPPSEEVTEEELASYSKDVQKRIKHLQRNYHDERREKEEALRERQALLQYVEALNKKVKEQEGDVTKSRQTIVDQAKRGAAVELEQAKAKYRAAHEAGDTDALVEAQSKLTEATIKFDKISNFKLPTVQPTENEVKQPVREQPRPVVDPRADAWRKENAWFGANDPDSTEKTAFALGVHQKLVASGVDPRTEDYYDKLNKRMREVFPDLRDDEDDLTPAPAATKKPSVVAPATRSVAPKKITLSKSELAIANRLGLTPLQYAKEVAALEK
jgi:hypothetical protein